MNRVNHIAGHVAEKSPVITIIGAGNSGTVCAALFHGNMNGKVFVQLLTSEPEKCSHRPKVIFPHGGEQEGYLSKISSSAEETIGNAEIVLWTGPVNATKSAFETIKPYVNKDTIIVTIFGQGLVHLLATRVFGRDVRFVALRNIPWLCANIKKGTVARIVGPKIKLEVALMNVSVDYLKTSLEPLFQVTGSDGHRWPTMEIVPDFTPIVFNPANQIIHPARYWAIFREYSGEPLTAPTEWLYRGMGEDAGIVLEILDDELQRLKDEYYKLTNAEGCKLVIPLRDRLIVQYGDQIADTSTLAKMVGTNKAYGMARTPMIAQKDGYVPNPSHRVVQDDIGWGLCVLLSVAERLKCEGVTTSTKMIRSLIEWHQKLMCKEFVVNGTLTGKDCTDLVLLKPDDSLMAVAFPE